MKRYWKWRFHFDNYGAADFGYFDDQGFGHTRNYWDIFQVPWDHVHKEKIEYDYIEKDIECTDAP